MKNTANGTKQLCLELDHSCLQRAKAINDKMNVPPPPPGGGGGLPYVCILGMCRARDPHFQP